MATKEEYQVGAAALAKVVQADIDADVPFMWRGMIPNNLVTALAAAGAKAVIDAIDAFRAEH